jgi:hypothetical protein
MADRTTHVLLEVGKTQRKFEINHAERLLKMPNNGGWQLPKDSEYQLDEKNGLIRRENKGATKKSSEKADHK